MTHSDDDGLVLPPKLAPAHVVIMPILAKAKDPDAVLAYCNTLADELRRQRFDGRPVRVELDARDLRGGDKAWQWIKRGVPVRLEVGQRDMDQDAVFVGRRDLPPKQKQGIPRAEFLTKLPALLQEIQDGLLKRAEAYCDANTHEIDDREAFYRFFSADGAADSAMRGGFALTHWSGDPAVESKVKEDLGVTVRCIPLEKSSPGTCPFTGDPSPQRVVWAKSY